MQYRSSDRPLDYTPITSDPEPWPVSLGTALYVVFGLGCLAVLFVGMGA